MNGIGKDPAFVLTLALGTFAVGGFVAVSHLGRTSEPVQMKSGFSTRFAPEQPAAATAAPASHIENFRRGTEVIKARAYAAASGFGFSFGGASAPRAATASASGNESWRRASSSSRGQYADGGPKDWASSYYKGPKGMSSGGSASWAASGSASQTGASASAPWTASGSDAAGDAAAGEEMPEVDAAAVARYARAQASPGAAGQATSAMYASLPSRSGSASSSGGYSQPAGAGNSFPSVEPGRPGTISGMRGGVSAADLGGMDEGMRSGSGGSYGAQMAGGAADVAAKVAAVPMPSGDAAKAVTPSGGSSSGGSSSGGSSAGGSGGATGSSAGTTPANTPKSTGNNSQPEVAPVLYASAQTPDLLQEIASEKLNGRDDKYLRSASPELKSMDDTADSGLDALLQPRTVHPSPAPAGSEKSVAPAQTNPDPENLEEVRAARREAIKTETHLFLHKLESRYGKMSDIQRVSCYSDRDTCFNHRLRGSYMTMVTATGAKLALGFKRTDGGSRGDRADGRRGFKRSDSGTREPAKWRLYTIDFIDGSGHRPGEAAGGTAEGGEEDE